MKKLFVILTLAILCVLIFPLCREKKSDAQITIKFSSWGSQSEVNLLKPLIKEFEEENPGVKIDFQHIPQNYFQKLHLLFASNLEPDVVFLNNLYAVKYMKAGLLEDLTPYFNQDLFFEKALQGFTSENKIYAVPRDVSDLVIFYNKDLFKKYGVSYPKADWTLVEYVKTAQALTKDLDGDKKTDIWGASYEKDVLYWLPFLFSNGASILSEDGKKLTYNEDSFANAMDLYSDMANKYGAAPKKSESASLTMAQMFLQKKIVMHLSGRWLVPKYREEAKFDWDIVNFPKGSEGSIVSIDSSGYAVSKSSGHKKEAIKFIQFLSSQKSMKKLAESGLIVPARKDAAYSVSFLSTDKKPKNSEAFLKAVETGKTTPVNEDYQKIIDNLNKTFEPLILGKKKARDIINSKN